MAIFTCSVMPDVLQSTFEYAGEATKAQEKLQRSPHTEKTQAAANNE
jgi:hypothetical protein